MCVRKCVRKGFVNCACVVGACGHILTCDGAIALLLPISETRFSTALFWAILRFCNSKTEDFSNLRSKNVLRCAIALFILVDREADEYVNHIYVPLHSMLIYGLHIRLPPYHLGSEVPLHTMYTYLRLTYSSASLSTRIKSTATYYSCSHFPYKLIKKFWKGEEW